MPCTSGFLVPGGIKTKMDTKIHIQTACASNVQDNTQASGFRSITRRCSIVGRSYSTQASGFRAITTCCSIVGRSGNYVSLFVFLTSWKSLSRFRHFPEKREVAVFLQDGALFRMSMNMPSAMQTSGCVRSITMRCSMAGRYKHEYGFFYIRLESYTQIIKPMRCDQS